MPNPSAVHPLRDENHKSHRVSFALSNEQLEVVDDAASRLGGWSRSQLIRHATLTTAHSIMASPSFGPDGLLAGLIPPADAQDPA